jgi:hypothetical protein
MSRSPPARVAFQRRVFFRAGPVSHVEMPLTGISDPGNDPRNNFGPSRSLKKSPFLRDQYSFIA